MPDGTLAHKTKLVQKWLHGILQAVLELRRNSSDFNPVENAWNRKKNKAQEHPSSIKELQEVLKRFVVSYGEKIYQQFGIFDVK